MKGTNYYVIQCTLSDHTFIFTIWKNLHKCTADQEEQGNNLSMCHDAGCNFFLFLFLLTKPSTQLLNGTHCTRLTLIILELGWDLPMWASWNETMYSTCILHAPRRRAISQEHDPSDIVILLQNTFISVFHWTMLVCRRTANISHLPIKMFCELMHSIKIYNTLTLWWEQPTHKIYWWLVFLSS